MMVSDKIRATAFLAGDLDDPCESLNVYGNILVVLGFEFLTIRANDRAYATRAGLALLVEWSALSSEAAKRCEAAVDVVRAQHAAIVAERERVASLCCELGMRPRYTEAALRRALTADVEQAERRLVEAQALVDATRARQAKALALMGES